MNWTLLNNSLLLGGFTALLATALGWCAALFAAGLPANSRRLSIVAAGMAFAMPPFLVIDCWLYYLGHSGVGKAWLPIDIYSLGGTVWILSLLLWPIPMLAALSAWSKLVPEQLEVDAALRGTKVIQHLLWPSARSALGGSAVLVFVLALNNFIVPATLQVRVFPAEVWVEFNTRFSYAAALQASWPLVVVPLVALWLGRHREIAWPRPSRSLAGALFRQRLGPACHLMAGVVAAAVTLLAVALPLGTMLANARTWVDLPGTISTALRSMGTSALIAVMVATGCVAYGLATRRWRGGWWLWLLFLVPGVLVGIGTIFLLNRPPFLAIYQSLFVVLLALTLRYAAWGWNGARIAGATLDRDLVDVARLHGASAWQRFRIAVWPQVAPQIAATWYIIYLLCLWDVETLVLIVPPGTETLALRIFNLLHYGHNPQVNGLCLLLLALAVAPLLLWELRHRLAAGPGRVVAVGVLTLAILSTGCSPSNSGETPVKSGIFSRVQIIGSRGTGAGQFNKPRSIAIDRDDNLYVVDMTGRVQKFSPDGGFLLQWQMPQTDKGRPKGMGTDPAGNIIVVEPHYSRVNHFATDGRLIRQWGRPGTNAGELSFPRAVAVNARGELLVSEYGTMERVQRFDPAGERLLQVIGQEGAGPGEFSRPEGIGVDSRDRLFVADSCNHRVQVFAGDGRFLQAFGQAGAGVGDLSYPYDVRIDPEGRQYVCEFGNSRIQVFDRDHRSIEILGGPGPGPGQLSNPWSIALDAAGNLYVADAGNHRVVKYLRAEPLAASARLAAARQSPIPRLP